MRPNTEADFWAKVDRRGPEDCWTWLASCNRAGEGYGQFRLEGKYMLAHRLAWSFTHGEIPEGMLVCHKCDNPVCCNPAHLFLGTPRDNMQDMLRKGRNAKTKRKKPACKNGHPYTPENTGRREHGKRMCRECARLAHASWRENNPEIFAAYRARLSASRRTGNFVGRPRRTHA